MDNIETLLRNSSEMLNRSPWPPERTAERHATVTKPSSVTLHVNFSFPLLAGALYSQTSVTKAAQVARW